MPITISLDPARLDLDAIHAILAGTYWSPDIRRDVVAEALRNSITAVAIDDATGATIGLARAVTDRATFAWLCEHQGVDTVMKLISTILRLPNVWRGCAFGHQVEDGLIYSTR